jgi:hypothetical protein
MITLRTVAALATPTLLAAAVITAPQAAAAAPRSTPTTLGPAAISLPISPASHGWLPPRHIPAGTTFDPCSDAGSCDPDPDPCSDSDICAFPCPACPRRDPPVSPAPDPPAGPVRVSAPGCPHSARRPAEI